MQSFKSFARSALRRVGLEKIHHPSLVDLIVHESIDTVLDVGANEGHYGLELRERGYKGRIVSFEPIGSVFSALERRASRDRLWDAYRLGVGEREDELSISVAAAPVFSSFKAPSAYAAGKFEGVRETRRELVRVVRLDDFLQEHPKYLSRTFLKIDTQGFEREVLAGAGERLRDFAGIQLEVPITPLYEGQDDLVATVRWMAERGFHITMAKENGFDWQALRLLELDIIFMKQGSATPGS